MAGRRPDFIIIGAMKCGTSTLHEQLAARSGLFLSTPKEPNFFSDDDQYARGLGFYEALFRDAREGQRCGESSTHYTKLPVYPDTVERLAAHVPAVQLVYVMRHPVDRLVSQYIHEWSQREVRGSLEQAVRRHERFQAYSCYARQLAPYRERFGAGSILPVFFERLVRWPDQELARICRFLGDPSPEPVRWVESVAPQNVSRDRMRRSALRRLLLSLPAMQAVKARLPTSVKEPLKGLWRMRRRPTPSPALLARLEQALDADLAVLGRWLGAPLSCRGWSEVVLQHGADWAQEPAP